jgi:hypothetical protein
MEPIPQIAFLLQAPQGEDPGPEDTRPEGIFGAVLTEFCAQLSGEPDEGIEPAASNPADMSHPVKEGELGQSKTEKAAALVLPDIFMPLFPPLDLVNIPFCEERGVDTGPISFPSPVPSMGQASQQTPILSPAGGFEDKGPGPQPEPSIMETLPTRSIPQVARVEHENSGPALELPPPSATPLPHDPNDPNPLRPLPPWGSAPHASESIIPTPEAGNSPATPSGMTDRVSVPSAEPNAVQEDPPEPLLETGALHSSNISPNIKEAAGLVYRIEDASLLRQDSTTPLIHASRSESGKTPETIPMPTDAPLEPASTHTPPHPVPVFRADSSAVTETEIQYQGPIEGGEGPLIVSEPVVEASHSMPVRPSKGEGLSGPGELFDSLVPKKVEPQTIPADIQMQPAADPSKIKETTPAEKRGDPPSSKDNPERNVLTSLEEIGGGKPAISSPSGSANHPASDPHRAEPIEVHQQISNRMLWSVKNGEEKIKLTLEPPHLGSVRIEILRDKESIQATVWTENQITKEILEGSRMALHKILREDGFRLDRLDVFLHQDLRSFQERRDPMPQERWRQTAEGSRPVSRTGVDLHPAEAATAVRIGRLDLFI